MRTLLANMWRFARENRAQLVIEFLVMAAGVFAGSLAARRLADSQWQREQEIASIQTKQRCAYQMEVARYAMARNTVRADLLRRFRADGTGRDVSLSPLECQPIQTLLESEEMGQLIKPEHLWVLGQYIATCQSVEAASTRLAQLPKDSHADNFRSVAEVVRGNAPMLVALGEVMNTEILAIVDTSPYRTQEFADKINAFSKRINERGAALMLGEEVPKKK